MGNDGHDVLTSAELAARLRVSVATIERWRFEGVGPRATKYGPRTVRYSRAEIERYEAERTT